MRKIKTIIVILAFCIGSIFSISVLSNPEEKDEVTEIKEIPSVTYISSTLASHSEEGFVSVITEESEEEQESLLPDEDIALIALVTMAEAEGECEEGKRLVIDTILNRIDYRSFPDTAYDVIYQPYQFSSMWNGRADRCEVQEDICQLVREELESRTNYEVIFFTAGYYSDYGVPMFQVENHYFSRYE